jgi:hypothetical protein
MKVYCEKVDIFESLMVDLSLLFPPVDWNPPSQSSWSDDENAEAEENVGIGPS